MNRFIERISLVGAALLIMAAALAPLRAHNPNLSTHFLNAHVDPNGGATIWSLNMNFGQSGLMTALEKRYGKNSLAGLSAKDLENTFVAYLKDTVSFEAEREGKPAEKVELHFTGAVLSGHHSLFRFELAGVPADTEKFFVTIRSGAEKRNHTNLLSLRIGESKSRIVLNADREWRGRVDLKPASPPWPNWIKVLMSLGATMAVILVLGLRTGGRKKAAA